MGLSFQLCRLDLLQGGCLFHPNSSDRSQHLPVGNTDSRAHVDPDAPTQTLKQLPYSYHRAGPTAQAALCLGPRWENSLISSAKAHSCLFNCCNEKVSMKPNTRPSHRESRASWTQQAQRESKQKSLGLRAGAPWAEASLPPPMSSTPVHTHSGMHRFQRKACSSYLHP